MLRLLATLCVLSVSIPVGAATFEDWATGRTLRVDYVHTGIASEEHFALERST